MESKLFVINCCCGRDLNTFIITSKVTVQTTVQKGIRKQEIGHRYKADRAGECGGKLRCAEYYTV